MPKHYEVRLGCYHLESSGAYAAVEGVEHGEEREAAAVEALSTSAEGVVGPVKAHASVPSLVSGPAPWFAICGNSNCIQRHGGHAIHVVRFWRALCNGNNSNVDYYSHVHRTLRNDFVLVLR